MVWAIILQDFCLEIYEVRCEFHVKYMSYLTDVNWNYTSLQHKYRAPKHKI
jgi:hypothetical protein